jgi:hypothetical protein
MHHRCVRSRQRRREVAAGWWPTSPSSRWVGRSITPESWPPTTSRTCPATASPRAGGTAPAPRRSAWRAKHRWPGSGGCSRAATRHRRAPRPSPRQGRCARVRRGAAADQERVGALRLGCCGDRPGGAGRSPRRCPGGGRLPGRAHRDPPRPRRCPARVRTGVLAVGFDHRTSRLGSQGRYFLSLNRYLFLAAKRSKRPELLFASQPRVVHGVLACAVLAAQVVGVVQPVRSGRAE